METPERKVKNQIVKYIKSLQNLGAKIYYEVREAGGFTYRKGLPDMWILALGKHIEVEIKKEHGGVLSTMQIKYQKIFSDLGVAIYTINSLDEFKDMLKEEAPTLLK